MAAAMPPNPMSSRWAASPSPSARLGRRLLLAAPGIGVLVFDGAHRGRALWPLAAANSYAWTALLSLAVWAGLLYAAARRSSWTGRLAATAFVLFYAVILGGQRYFFEQYRTYLSAELGLFAADFLASVKGQFWADIGHYSLVTLPLGVLGFGLVWGARRVVDPQPALARWAAVLGPLAVVGCVLVPWRPRPALAATPDLLYLDAVGGLVRALWGPPRYRPEDTIRPRHSLSLPRLSPRSARPRNVILAIVESTRADSACIEYDPECLFTQRTNRLFPRRFPLLGLHAVDTVTSTSLAVLTTGLGPHESVEVMHSWPLIFDYAKAAGYDGAFWTSQNLNFGKSRLWVQDLGVSHSVSGTDLDPNADIDIGADERLLAERVQADLDQLREPFLAVIQLSNVHFPYLVAPDLPRPHAPAYFSKSPSESREFYNFYLNAVFQEDYHLGAMLERLARSERGRRTVIVYTADHGEAFREHGQLGHTMSLYEEELHVPAWIDAPDGTLTPEEEHALRAKRAAPTFHLDLVPTVLDLLGLWDDPTLGFYKERMPGTSLIRPPLTTRPVPLTNCSVVWGCAFENWGFMQGSRKLIARVGDPDWRCFDVAADPRDLHDLGPAACGDLATRALALFGRLPGR
jgi:hypothetical protein